MRCDLESTQMNRAIKVLPCVPAQSITCEHFIHGSQRTLTERPCGQCLIRTRCRLQYTRSLRGRNLRSENVPRRRRFNDHLRRIVVHT